MILHAIPIAAAMVLAFSTLAHAECGWVLWIESMFAGRAMSSSTTWNFVSGYSREVQYQEEASDKIKQAGSRKPTSDVVRNEVKTQGNYVTTETYQANELIATSIVRFVCVSDTIDPRGPRGSRELA
jgi:hypothetical protein